MNSAQCIGKMARLGWRMMRVIFQLLYGAWHVFRLPQPIVAIFGGSALLEGDLYAQQGFALSRMLVDAGVSVITGGGPGLMQAASCGAVAQGPGKGGSLGIGVKGLGDKPNSCVQKYIELDYFFARKWLLTHYSGGFIVFPGGYGTLDELAELLTLAQTSKQPPRPIVLIGTEYWHPFVDWLNKEVLEHGFIFKENLGLFLVTDDLEKAFCTVRDACVVDHKEDRA